MNKRNQYHSLLLEILVPLELVRVYPLILRLRLISVRALKDVLLSGYELSLILSATILWMLKKIHLELTSRKQSATCSCRAWRWSGESSGFCSCSGRTFRGACSSGPHAGSTFAWKFGYTKKTCIDTYTLTVREKDDARYRPCCSSGCLRREPKFHTLRTIHLFLVTTSYSINDLSFQTVWPWCGHF